ncbi:thymidine kinase 2, mitochondrial [Plakobranchus ocellatus]|uniref:Thymidine kinase 2, mitochondrial n=1 Tax=Plakobranchus ocellatus TaxID=259542 RepID=A0AAV3ZWV6_9GAST|nr:thymidine kinase 2, mitochondrial [Plakobranchus ocellatus]
MLNTHFRCAASSFVSLSGLELKLIWRELQRKFRTGVDVSQGGARPFFPRASSIHNLYKKMRQRSERTSNLEGVKQSSKLSPSKSITVAVEGNIGSGKSTLLKHFECMPYCEVVGEPLNQWTNLDGHNALGLLYENPDRWSFSFNMFAQLTRMDMHLKPNTLPVKMLERSLYSTRYCFVQNDYLNKTINAFEYSVFTQWFDFLVRDGKADIDLIVYLRADPSICYERLKRRSRQEEVGVPMSLIESLHKLHDEWLLQKKFPVPAPVLVLDANNDLDAMKEVYNTRRQEILCGY